MDAVEDVRGAAVTAEGLGLEGPRGWAFRSVDLDVPAGTLVAVEGPSGSGRTCLLLALTGRMRTTEGSARVAGLALPRRMAAVRGISALGPVPGVSELDPALTVAEHLRERALLQRRFGGPFRSLLHPRATRAEARERVDRALEAAGLDLDGLPKRERTAVRDLERLESLRLSVALALVGRPLLLAVDDTDLKLSDAERAQAWELLRSVAASGTTVLAVCSQAPEGVGAVVVRTSGATAAQTTGAGGNGGPAGTGTPDPATAPAAGPEGTGPGSPAHDRTAPDDEPTTPDHDRTTRDEEQTLVDGEPTAPDRGATAPRDAGGQAGGDQQDTTEEGAADALAETGRA